MNARRNELVAAVPRTVDAGARLELEVEYRGQLIDISGSGATVLRSTTGWHPRAGTVDRATYSVTAHWPADYDLVVPGAVEVLDDFPGIDVERLGAHVLGPLGRRAADRDDDLLDASGQFVAGSSTIESHTWNRNKSPSLIKYWDRTKPGGYNSHWGTRDVFLARLADIAEFAALVARYPKEILPAHFWKVIRRHDLITPIGTYALMAGLLMRSVIKTPGIQQANWHRDRLLQSSPPAANRAGLLAANRPLFWRVISFVYDQGHLPAWTWRNVCYGDDQTSTPARLGCIGRQMATRLFRILHAFIGSLRRKYGRAPNTVESE